jgi:hypothetical protein
VFFGLPVAISSCSKATPWLAQVRSFVAIWKDAGVHVYLIPALGRAGTTTPSSTVAEYEQLAQRDPGSVSVLDPSVFVRDAKDRYEWRSPCLTASESGCANHTVAVRMIADGGQHLCALPNQVPVCPAALAGGARRGAAAIAAELLSAPQFVALLDAPR